MTPQLDSGRGRRRARARICASVIVVLFVLVGRIPAVSQNLLDLPEAAEPFWEEGLDGFRQGDWARAIRNLAEVQKIAPSVPAVIYNLALSYDFSAFQELTAMGWLSTYVAAAPDARNIPQTQVRIEDLDRAALERLIGMFETAKEAAEPLRQLANPTDFITAYQRIARAQAESRVVGGEALGTANAIRERCGLCPAIRSARERLVAIQGILEAQLLAGDLDQAIETARAIETDLGARDDAFAEIASAYAARGEMDRAEEAVREIADADKRAAAGRSVEAALAVDSANRGPRGETSDLDAWLQFMADEASSLEAMTAIFRNPPEGEPLAIVDRWKEAAVAYGSALARLREMRGLP